MIANVEQVDTSLSSLAWTYHRWGWATVPLRVGTKAAARKWKMWFDAFPPDHWIKSNWPETSNRNIAVICGQVSGGLIVRDFDDAAEYEAWREQFPGLADRLPTVRTRRGFHVYLIDADGSTRSRELRPHQDGEIKGDGAYVVAAGSTVSKDRDGNELEPFTYYWTNPPQFDPEDGKPIIPMVSLSRSGLVVSDQTLHSTPSRPTTTNTPSKNQQPQQPQQYTGRGERPSQNENHEAVDVPDDGKLVDLVQRHPIDGPGQRNAALWRLAVDLRVTFGGVPDEDTIELVLRTWLSLNKDHCRTREWLENWSEFYSMVHRVDGENKAFLSSLPPLYESTPLPSWAQSLRGGPSLERISRVVAAADQLADGKPFYLSLRTIAKVAGEMTAPTAKAGMKHLINKGLVDLVEAGEARPRGKANVYQVLVNEDGSRRELD